MRYFDKERLGIYIADPNLSKDSAGSSPLHCACSTNNENTVRIVEFLLDQGADPNSPNIKKFTPLHIASQKENYLVVEALIKYGADTNAQNVFKQTPIMLCKD